MSEPRPCRARNCRKQRLAGAWCGEHEVVADASRRRAWGAKVEAYRAPPPDLPEKPLEGLSRMTDIETATNGRTYSKPVSEVNAVIESFRNKPRRQGVTAERQRERLRRFGVDLGPDPSP